MTNSTFIVDPLLEDNPKKEDEEKTDKNIDAKDVEMPLGITQTFAMIKEGNWNGLVGDEHVPSVVIAATLIRVQIMVCSCFMVWVVHYILFSIKAYWFTEWLQHCFFLYAANDGSYQTRQVR